MAELADTSWSKYGMLYAEMRDRAEFAAFVREQLELHRRLVEDVDLKLGQ